MLHECEGLERLRFLTQGEIHPQMKTNKSVKAFKKDRAGQEALNPGYGTTRPSKVPLV